MVKNVDINPLTCGESFEHSEKKKRNKGPRFGEEKWGAPALRFPFMGQA